MLSFKVLKSLTVNSKAGGQFESFVSEVSKF